MCDRPAKFRASRRTRHRPLCLFVRGREWASAGVLVSVSVVSERSGLVYMVAYACVAQCRGRDVCADVCVYACSGVCTDKIISCGVPRDAACTYAVLNLGATHCMSSKSAITHTIGQVPICRGALDWSDGLRERVTERYRVHHSWDLFNLGY